MADETVGAAGEERPGFKPPRNVPPPSLRALRQVVNRYAEYHGVAPNRVQRWIAFTVLGAALSRLSTDAGEPAFLIKGGVSMELRLGLKARATKDFDTTFRGERDTVLAALEQALTEAYEGFTFRIRGKQAWPPTVASHPGWAEPFAALAREGEIPVPDAEQAASDVAEYVKMIAEA